MYIYIYIGNDIYDIYICIMYMVKSKLCPHPRSGSVALI